MPLYLNLDLISLIPIVALYFFSALRVYPSLNAILLNRLSLIQTQISINHIYNEILEKNKSVDDYDDNTQNINFENSIELKDVSFNIEKGIMVAIVGPSGAGKSTIADLISRFYDVTTGAILIDGNDLRDININSLRNNLGIVTQETILFDETIEL